MAYGGQILVETVLPATLSGADPPLETLFLLGGHPVAPPRPVQHGPGQHAVPRRGQVHGAAHDLLNGWQLLPHS